MDEHNPGGDTTKFSNTVPNMPNMPNNTMNKVLFKKREILVYPNINYSDPSQIMPIQNLLLVFTVFDFDVKISENESFFISTNMYHRTHSENTAYNHFGPDRLPPK
jgi:hypothetical protein